MPQVIRCVGALVGLLLIVCGPGCGPKATPTPKSPAPGHEAGLPAQHAAEAPAGTPAGEAPQGAAAEAAASDAAPAEAPAATPAAESPPESAAPAAAPAAAAPTESPTESPTEPPAETPAAAPTDAPSASSPESPASATSEAPSSTTSSRVILGDPSLTAGIPGEGELTIEQITAWLATPGVHDPLEFELPLGLAQAAPQITGVAENPLTRAKIELGRQLYFDGRLSSDGTISCASCHDPSQGFAAHTPFGVGVQKQTGNRNSPVSYNRILSGAQFWDGRAASLEEQAKGPIQNPIEMGNTHEQAIATIQGREGYVLQFAAVFGPDSVNIDNVARAIAAFERVLVTGPAPYDYYAALKPFEDQFPSQDDLDALKEDDPGLFAKYEQTKAASDAHPMSDSAKRGMVLFFSEKSNCTACHAGANFTDEKYHNLGVGMDAAEPDLGRFVVTGDEKDRGAFKTPTIRNVALSGPYMHDGSQKTLEEVVEWYAKGGHPNPHLSDKIKKLDLSSQDKADLVAFMQACSGEFPVVAAGRLP